MRITILTLVTLIAIGSIFVEPNQDSWPGVSHPPLSKGAIAFDEVRGKMIYPRDTITLFYNYECRCWDLKSNKIQIKDYDTVSIMGKLDDDLEDQIIELIDLHKD